MSPLYITGAGVSKDSGIPTFRGEDGFWTIGSRNYTPQEMATRQMYLHDPEQFLLWYFKRFATYRNVRPNLVHEWLAGECNRPDGGQPHARLITQNIDGLDGKAGNGDYISIHGRLDKMTVLHDQAEASAQVPLIDAPWQRVIDMVGEKNAQNDTSDDALLTEALLDVCQIDPVSGPQMNVSLKPYVLLFDEYYTDLYRMSEAEDWMMAADRMVFMGTSFSVNITMIALRMALQRRIPIEIVDPEPVDIEAMFGLEPGAMDITYHAMSAQSWIDKTS